MNKSLTTLIIASTFTLAACGGGGGDGTTTYSYTGPTAAVTLDSDNIGPIADNAMSSNEMNFDPTPLLTSLSSTEGEQIPNTFEAVATLLDVISNNVTIANTSRQLIAASTTLSCLGGGTFTLEGTEEDIIAFDNNSYSGGESVSMTFNGCNDNEGTTLNGSVTLTVTIANGDYITPSGDWDLGFRILFNQLSFNGTSLLMHGNIVSEANGNQATGIDSNRMSGTSLFVMSGSQQALLSNFDMNIAVNSAGDTTVESDYTYAGTDIGGSITVDTTTPFVTTSGETYPYPGAMTITGAEGAWISLEAQPDLTNVYLEWDFVPVNTPSAPDNNATVQWSTLNSWTP